MTPEVTEIVDLARRFLSDEVEAEVFDRSVRRLFSLLPEVGAPTFGILEDLAIACSDFVPEPEFRDDDEIDEAELRSAARRALDRLAREAREHR